MKKGLIAVIVAVVAAGGIAAYVVVNKKNNATPRTTTSSSSSSNSDNMTKQNSNSSNPVATNLVIIKDMAFSPAAITVAKGTTVTWINNDAANHTVTGDTNDGPQSESLSNGDTYAFTFTKAGTYAYHCKFHSFMTGTVTVTE